MAEVSDGMIVDVLDDVRGLDELFARRARSRGWTAVIASAAWGPIWRRTAEKTEYLSVGDGAVIILFTAGSGSTLHADAVRNFLAGFVRLAST